MALTNFAAMQDHEYLAWARETWKKLRESSFIMQKMGTGPMAGIQKITELTATPAGNKVIINLLHELEDEGVVGDATLKGNEEEAKMSQLDMVFDQVRHGIANTGRMSDQKGVLKIRNEAKDLLAYHGAQRADQLAFLTMAGVEYKYKTNGALRSNQKYMDLEFASYVQPPSARRHFRWDGTNDKLVAGDDTSNLIIDDTLSYKSLVELKAAAHDLYIRPLQMNGGVEYFEIYCNPQAMKSLKLDPEFHEALKLAMPRSPDNPIFKGADVFYVDGLAIYSYRHSFNTRGLASGSKWGDGTIDGNRVTLCGAQGLAYTELGNPMWNEELDDYDARWGVALAQIIGFLKPQVPDPDAGMDKEDFGLLSMDVALNV